MVTEGTPSATSSATAKKARNNRNQAAAPQLTLIPKLFLLVGLILIHDLLRAIHDNHTLKKNAEWTMSLKQQTKAQVARVSLHQNDNMSETTCHQDGTVVDENGLDMDTSVIVTSSLIPTWPSIYMINQTIQSLHFLDGLSPRAPIYVTIDGLPQNHTDGLVRILGYIKNLNDAFRHRPNFHVLVSDQHLHIGGSIKMAIDRIHTTYVYVVQHDFPFVHRIDHTNLRKSFEEYPQYFRNVRFPKQLNNTIQICPTYMRQFNLTTRNTTDGRVVPMTTPVDYVNGLEFYFSRRYSDNNQFSSREWWIATLGQIKFLKRPPEGPLEYSAARNCTAFGQMVYGSFGSSGNYIQHLDGKNTQARRTTQSSTYDRLNHSSLF